MPEITDVVDNQFGLVDKLMSCNECRGVVKITANVKAFVKARISGLVSPKPAQMLNYKFSHSRVPSAVLLQMQCCVHVLLLQVTI
jgi:hypothetical protein